MRRHGLKLPIWLLDSQTASLTGSQQQLKPHILHKHTHIHRPASQTATALRMALTVSTRFVLRQNFNNTNDSNSRKSPNSCLVGSSCWRLKIAVAEVAVKRPRKGHFDKSRYECVRFCCIGFCYCLYAQICICMCA